MTAPADTLVERLEKESNDIRSVHQIRGADLIVWHRTMAEAAARIRELEAKYMELIMAVEKKWPNETRHQTALRYILEREVQSTDMGAKESK